MIFVLNFLCMFCTNYSWAMQDESVVSSSETKSPSVKVISFNDENHQWAFSASKASQDWIKEWLDQTALLPEKIQTVASIGNGQGINNEGIFSINDQWILKIHKGDAQKIASRSYKVAHDSALQSLTSPSIVRDMWTGYLLVGKEMHALSLMPYVKGRCIEDTLEKLDQSLSEKKDLPRLSVQKERSFYLYEWLKGIALISKAYGHLHSKGMENQKAPEEATALEDLTSSYIHGDPWLCNIVLKEKSVTLIDTADMAEVLDKGAKVSIKQEIHSLMSYLTFWFRTYHNYYHSKKDLAFRKAYLETFVSEYCNPYGDQAPYVHRLILKDLMEYHQKHQKNSKTPPKKLKLLLDEIALKNKPGVSS